MQEQPSGDDTPKKTPTANLCPPWQPGQSGNPAGRPKGARSRLSEDFFKALAEDFAEHGVKAIEMMRADRPGDYAKMVASLQTKEMGGPDGEAIPLSVIERRIVRPKD